MSSSPDQQQQQDHNNISHQQQNRSNHNQTPTPGGGALPPPSRMWTPTPSKKISQEELDAFTERQLRFVQHKKARVEALETKFYGGGDDHHQHHSKNRVKTLNHEGLEKSVARQHDQETQLREERRKALEDKYAPALAKKVTMEHDTVLDVAKRMQDQATLTQQKKKKAIEEKQRQIEEEAKLVQKGRSMTKDAIKSMGDRLCQPKKELSYEEMNQRLFGKTVQLPAKYVAAARRMEEEQAEAKKLAKKGDH